MKKLIATTLAAMMFSVFSPDAPLAHAGALENQLTQVIAQNANATRIQQLLTIKKQLEEGKKQDVLQTITAAVMEQSGKNGVNDIANLIKQGNIGQVAGQVLRQQVEQRLTESIAPYENKVALIAGLFKNPVLNSPVNHEHQSLTVPPVAYKRIVNMTATAYAPGPLDNGKWNNQTYMGGTVRKGVAAVDPKIIPMGTKLWIEGYGEAIAEDQGSAIKGHRIDLAFEDRQEALDYGIKNVKIYVLD